MKFFVAAAALAALAAASPVKQPTIDKSDTAECRACADKCSESHGPLLAIACKTVSCVTECTDILPTIAI